MQYGLTRPKSMWDPTPVYSMPFTDAFLRRLLHQDSKGTDVTAYSDAQLGCEYQSEVYEQLSLIGAAAGFLAGGGYGGSQASKDGLLDAMNKSGFRPTQSAKRFDMSKVDEYAEVMQKRNWNWKGMRYPIVVDTKGNIMSGHHGILAAEKAKVKIPENAIKRFPKETARPSYSWNDILK